MTTKKTAAPDLLTCAAYKGVTLGKAYVTRNGSIVRITKGGNWDPWGVMVVSAAGFKAGEELCLDSNGDHNGANPLRWIGGAWGSEMDIMHEYTESKPKKAKTTIKKDPAVKYTLNLTPIEAQVLRDLTGSHVVGDGPSRQACDAIYDKLGRLGLRCREEETQDGIKGRLNCFIVQEAKPAPKQPIFKVGEVWKGKAGHLIRIDKITEDDGVLYGIAQVIFSPAGAFPYTAGTDWRIHPEGGYGSSNNMDDYLALVSKVSP